MRKPGRHCCHAGLIGSSVLGFGISAQAQPKQPVTQQTERVEFRLSESWSVPVVHTLSLLTTMRVTEAWLWPHPFAETRGKVLLGHYKDAFTRAPKWDSGLAPFEWDDDRWEINVIGHGLLGSELYFRSRLCRQGPWASLAFAAASSASWEYLFEAGGVRPSALDLWFTPLAGAALGELRLWAWRSATALNPQARSIVRVLVDPMGELERSAGSPC